MILSLSKRDWHFFKMLYNPALVLLDIYSRKMKHYIHTNIWKQVELEVAKTRINLNARNRWTDKQVLVYPYNKKNTKYNKTTYLHKQWHMNLKTVLWNEERQGAYTAWFYIDNFLRMQINLQWQISGCLGRSMSE